MKKLLYPIAISFLICSVAGAQKYATCKDAVEISASSFGPVAPTGATDKTVSKRHSHGFYFEREHNITWITFVVPNDTVLTFDLIPQKPHDDIDFLLFRDESNFCKKIAERKIKPVRSNLAKTDSSHGNTTGLSLNAVDSIVPPGNNSPFSKALKVKAGERYYLVVDNYTEARGSFKLDLHLKFVKYEPEETESRTEVQNIDAAPVKAPRIGPPGKTKLNIVVTDSAGRPLKAQLDITGIRPGKIISADTTAYSLTLNPKQSINVNCNASGYMFNQASFTAPDTASEQSLNMQMETVVEHKNFVLSNIKFHEGNAVFLSSSQDELMNLLVFMRSNPAVKIVIKGYVNDPDNKNSGPAKKLSKQRAKAVQDFLAASGIDPKRMRYKGFGNAHMIFPRPANDAQAEANRRVEIEVVK